jgi:hypothetical protein
MKQEPPKPTHVPGTNRGEELARRKGREPGRAKNRRYYRSARDSTGLDAESHGPIDPRMPEMPPA